MTFPSEYLPQGARAPLRDTQLGDLRYVFAWATRRRKPFLVDVVLARTCTLFDEAARAIGARVVDVQSGGDHVVVAVEAPPEIAPAVIAERLKRYSAGHLRREFPQLRKLPSVWTRRYLATTQHAIAPDRLAEFVSRQPRDERRRQLEFFEPGAPPIEGTFTL